MIILPSTSSCFCIWPMPHCSKQKDNHHLEPENSPAISDFLNKDRGPTNQGLSYDYFFFLFKSIYLLYFKNNNKYLSHEKNCCIISNLLQSNNTYIFQNSKKKKNLHVAFSGKKKRDKYCVFFINNFEIIILKLIM